MSASTEVVESSRPVWLPRGIRMSHINLPSRDLAESRRFFVEVLGGHLMQEGPEEMRVRFANFEVVVGRQDGGATAPHLEYPHYAFTVPADQFVSWMRRLEGFGIPTHDPWTRAGETHTIMYFRDPSGNQFELFCPAGDTGLKLRLGNRAGGDYVVPYTTLGYRKISGPGSGTPALPPTPLAYNHMTIPAKDFGESRRFFTAIFGCAVAFEIPKIHVTVVIGGADVGYGGPADQNWPWPAPDARYPRYTIGIRAEDFIPMKERLGQFGVPTSEVWAPTGDDAAIYFRDPSSNLWELYCAEGLSGVGQQGGARGRERHVPDVAALRYDTWRDPGD